MDNLADQISNKPLVIDFSAPWSGTNAMMDPVLHRVKEQVGDRADILKVDIDKSPHYCELYNVSSVPTILIVQNGNIIWRKNGRASAEEILHELNFHIM